MTTVLDGATAARERRAELALAAARLAEAGHRPTLGLLSASDEPGARSYARALRKAADATDVELVDAELDPDVAPERLEQTVAGWAADPMVHGIALVTRLPASVDRAALGARVPPVKDVDGITPASSGRLLLGLPAHAPATALAVIELIRAAGHPGPRVLRAGDRFVAITDARVRLFEHRRGRRPVMVAAAVVTPAGAAAATTWMVLAGHQGAKVTWSGVGQTNAAS